MTNAFIQLTQQGKNNGWRYGVGALVALFTFIVPGSIVSAGLLAVYVQSDSNPETMLRSPDAVASGESFVAGASALTLFVFNNLAFLFFWLGIYLAVRYLHGRSLHTLITPKSRISWRRVAQGFVVFFGLSVAEILIGYAIAPTDFTLNFEAKTFFIFLAWAALLTPIQTAAEELFFRGYLLQGIGSKLGKWPAILLTAGLFSFLHGQNLEVSTQENLEGTISIMGYYLMIGAFLAWLTLKDQTLELALGIHAANNMAAFLLVTSENTSIPSPAIFSVSAIEADISLLFFSALLLLVFLFIIFRVLKKPILPAKNG